MAKRTGNGPKHTAVFGTRTKDTPTFSKPGTLTKDPCPFCKEEHALYECEKFRKLKRFKGVNFLSSERRCFRCLVQGHVMRDCDAAQGCSVAGCADPRHHTLLH